MEESFGDADVQEMSKKIALARKEFSRMISPIVITQCCRSMIVVL